MKPLLVVLLFTMAILAGGCSRAKITTEIKPDGSFARTVVLTGKVKKEGMQVPGLDETFVLPAGSGWTSKEETKDDDRTVTFVRTFAAGGASKGDLTLKGDQPDKPNLSNEASVMRSGPRRFEYRETLRWTGTIPDSMNKVKPEDLAEIKAALPKALATDQNARGLMQHTATLMIPMLFGPGDSVLAIGMMHPELAERRLTQRIWSSLNQALQDQFGARMTADERRAVTTRLVRVSMSNTKPAAPDPAAGPQGSNSSSLTPLMFILRAPGKVISTNGERDDFAGEIYWALYPEAALFKEVTLSAVCDLDAK
jgi:hypothetical protein